MFSLKSSDYICCFSSPGAVPAWPVVRFLLPGLALAFILISIIIIIFSVRVKLQHERQAEKVALESPVIGTPTDTGERAGRQLLPVTAGSF